LVRAVGIDPGTLSFDLCALEDGRPFMEKSISTKELLEKPHTIVNILLSTTPLDAVVGPSGYGICLKTADEVTDLDVKFMTLTRPDDPTRGRLLPLAPIIRSLKASGLKVYFIPGVVLLSTVPAHRKSNRIDMGTADKVCSAALAIFDQSRRYGIPYDSTSFIMVEMGYGFNATIGVEGGKIVDGIGGTMGGPGFTAAGCLDGEVAYLIGRINKGMLFSGGAADIVGCPDMVPEEFVSKGGSGWLAFMEGIEKNVSAMAVSVKQPREILLSGRLARVESILNKISRALSKYGDVRRVEGIAKTSKESAQGAALIADGLAGGRFKDLVETIRIREATGTALDNVRLRSFDEAKRHFLS